ncbi:MAG: hypothetical protein R2734_20735 [Nocardioides sp.]
MGSKLRRPAGVSLVTYRDGRPVGVQPVLIQTNGTFSVGPSRRSPTDEVGAVAARGGEFGPREVGAVAARGGAVAAQVGAVVRLCGTW